MKKTAVLMLLGMIAIQARADLSIASGDIWIDATTNNTTATDGSAFTAISDTAGLWRTRGGYGGYNASGIKGGAGEFIFEDANDGWGSTAPAFGLKTTASGLIEGQQYNVYVVYLSKSGAENWAVTGSLSPITTNANGTVTSGYTYGFASNTYTDSVDVVSISAGELIDSDTYSGFRGWVGTVTADASGTLDVYIEDYTENAADRTWYDGVYVEAIPEPATFGLLAVFGAGLIAIRNKFHR